MPCLAVRWKRATTKFELKDSLSWYESSSPGPWAARSSWCCWPSRWPAAGRSRSFGSMSRRIPIPRRPSSKWSPQYPGASAEEVERQVTIPLEVTLAGMPGLQVHPQQVAVRPGPPAQPVRLRRGLLQRPRQEVINRLQFVSQPAHGRQPADLARSRQPAKSDPLHAAQPHGYRRQADSTRSTTSRPCRTGLLEREFPPRAADRRRHRLRRHGQALRDPSRPRAAQALRHHLAAGSGRASATATPTSAATILRQGQTAMNVRGIGLFGGGLDPHAAGPGHDRSPYAGRRLICAEEQRTLREIRQIVITSVNNVPVRVDDVVRRRPACQRRDKTLASSGVVVGNQTRQGKVSIAPAGTRQMPSGTTATRWSDRGRQDPGHRPAAQGRGVAAGPGRRQGEDRGAEQPTGRLLPGVEIEPLLRPHRPDRRDHRDRAAKTCWWAWCW